MNKTYIGSINNKTFSVVACSVKGQDKDFNQDAFAVALGTDGLICVLADGLGSAINSEIGAEAVCKEAIALIKEEGVSDAFPARLKKKWMDSLYHKPLSCDTTFKFIQITATEIIYGGIGDGWLTGVLDGKIIDVQSSERFSNQTQSMMSIGYNENFKIFRKAYKDIQVLSLATDGFSEDIEGENVQAFLIDGLKEMQADANSFAKSLERMIENWPIKSNQDDKTIIMIGVIK